MDEYHFTRGLFTSWRALIECTNDFCKNVKLLYIYKGREKNREKRCCIIIFVITELINFYSYFFYKLYSFKNPISFNQIFAFVQ